MSDPEPQVEPEAEPSTTVSGASFASPGLGADAEPRAAAAANQPGFSQRVDDKPKPESNPGGTSEAGPLAPVLKHPAVQKKPELLLLGGVAAGFVLAKVLKALTSSDE